MELKNAVTVCLISLCSATLVVLIARALDLQAASQVEPQLAKIAEELQLLRKQGGLATAAGEAAGSESVGDCLMVYYFHGERCANCRAIEAQAHETVQSEFASQLESGEVAWKVLDYLKDPAGMELAKKFRVADPVVVLARMQGGQIEDWKRLDRVRALVHDKPAFSEYVRDEISQMLKTAEEQPTAAPNGDAPEIPLPDPDLRDIPVPAAPADVPVPQ